MGGSSGGNHTLGLISYINAKGEGLGVLLVDGQLGDAVMFIAVLHQLAAQAVAPDGGSEKEHLQPMVFHTHKSDGLTGGVFGDDQIFNSR